MPIFTTLGAACAKAWGFTSGLITDQYFNLVSLLLPGNGTNGANNNEFLDSGTANSGSGFTITRNGNTTQGTFSPFSQTGWGNYFNGSSNYRLTIPDSTDLDIAGDFCLEMWAYFTSTSGSNQLVCIGSENAAQNGFVFYQTNTSEVLLYTNGSSAITTSSAGITTNRWYHLALVRSGTGAGNTVIYVDGVSRGSAQITTSFTGLAANGLSIGQTYNGSFVGVCNAYLSNIRLVNGSPVYTGAFTPPTTPLTAITNTKLLTCQSNRFVDTNTQVAAKTITVTGSPSVTPFSPFAPTQPYSAAAVGGSGYFDGTGDYLTVPSNAAFNLSSGAYTVELFVYFLSVPTTVILFNLAGTGTTGYVQLLYSSGALAWQERGTATNQTTYSWTPVTGQWYHIVVGWNGSNSLAFWINGTRVTTNTVTPTGSGQNGVAVGGASDGFNLTGYINSLRIVKGTDVYGVSNTSITVPTAPLTAVSGTSLLLNFTNAGVVDATAKNVLETVGSAQISTTQSKWGGGSISVSSGNYLTAPSNVLLPFGTGDFTIEFWAYWNGGAFTNYATVIDTRNGSFAGGLAIAANITTGAWYVSIAAQEILSTTAAAASWQHVAVTRQGTSLKLFVNGTQAGSTYTSSDNFSNTTLRVGVRPDNQYPWNGYIDDLRITKGLARYTGTTLTVPPAPFPVQ